MNILENSQIQFEKQFKPSLMYPLKEYYPILTDEIINQIQNLIYQDYPKYKNNTFSLKMFDEYVIMYLKSINKYDEYIENKIKQFYQIKKLYKEIKN